MIMGLLALSLAACGSGESSGAPQSTGGTPPPIDAPEPAVLLEIRDEGGFVPVEYNLTRIPRFVVMTDGTVHGPGPETLIYPRPMLPNIVTTSLEAATLAEVEQLLDDMDLFEIDDERNREAAAVIADAPETVVTAYDASGSHTYGVYALGFDEVPTGDPRVEQLERLISTLDEATATSSSTEPYTPERAEVFTQPFQGGLDPEFSDIRPWPASIDLEDMQPGPVGFSCMLVDGPELEELLSTLAEASQVSTFELDGTEYTMAVRILFPHQEPSC